MKRIQAGESPVGEKEELSARDRAIERLIFGLRMVDGIEVAAFESAVGQTLEDLTGGTIESLIQRGLAEKTETHVRLTESGRMLADTVSVELL